MAQAPLTIGLMQRLEEGAAYLQALAQSREVAGEYEAARECRGSAKALR